MLLVWLKFIVCVLLILFAGRNVAKYGDIIADKTGLGGLWIGVVLVAMATSLPELFTGISAVTLLKAPDLAVGDVFGANTFNLFNLALLDIAYRHGPLLTKASPRHALSGGLSIIMVAFPSVCLLISSMVSTLAIGWIGIYTPVILILYLFILRLLFDFEKNERIESSLDVEMVSESEGIALRRAYFFYALSAIVIIAAGVWLAFVGKDLARMTGWEQSFIGSLLLAFTTTLPEITVSFSALRLGAVDLCVANMIGSNIFNMMLLAIFDLFYAEGPILAAVSQSHVFTALIVVLMSGIFIAGLVFRPQHKTPLKASWYAIGLIVVFIVGACINFVI